MTQLEVVEMVVGCVVETTATELNRVSGDFYREEYKLRSGRYLQVLYDGGKTIDCRIGDVWAWNKPVEWKFRSRRPRKWIVG
jgi:hypothetical protein